MTTPPIRRFHAARVVSTHLRLGAMQELQYRTHVWTYFISTIMAMFMSLASVAVVYRQVDSLHGWSRDELLVVVGIFFIVSGIINGSIHRSLASFAADIRSGDFDYRLLKPIDAHLLSSIRSIDVWRIFDTVAGCILVGYAVWKLEAAGHGGTTATYLAAPLLLTLMLFMLTGFWSLIAGFAFWTTRIEGALYALDEMLDNIRWPITIFPPGLRLALTTIFPAGFAITVPTEALTGRLTPTLILTSIVVTVAMFGGARLLWAAGMRRYASASS